MLIGDSHGNAQHLDVALKLAVDLDIEYVIHLGDFGFWPHSSFAADIRRQAIRYGLVLWVVDGNHDCPTEYDVWDEPRTVLPRGCTFQLGSAKFGALGGAVSIDKAIRHEGTSWWPEEAVTHNDVAVAIDGGPVDVWLTHDCVGTPVRLPTYHFADARLQMALNVQEERMQTVFDAIRPKLHVHGHHHIRYSERTQYGVRVGLAAEFPLSASVAILDTETLSIR